MIYSVNAPLLDALVLSLVCKGDTYGYKITQEMREAIEVSESTLYPVLRRLQNDGCLKTYDKATDGRNRRYYAPTRKGELQLQVYIEEWRGYKEALENILLGGGQKND